MNVKKLKAFCVSLMLCFGFVGWNSFGIQGAVAPSKKIQVVTSFYPIFSFASEIGGEDVSVVQLLPTGVDPHHWTPRSQDLANTSKAKLFLYNGAGMEGWIPNFLKGLDSNAKVKSVAVSKGIKLITGKHKHECCHCHHHQKNEEHSKSADSGHEVDPHTWVSPQSALIMAKNIRDSLVAVDPKHRGAYDKRYKKLENKLKALHNEFHTQLSKVKGRDIVVSHQAFGYLARDYGLKQHALMGLSADAEPTGQDMIKLSNFVKQKGIKHIFSEQLVSDKIAKTLAAEAGVETMVLDPVEGLTKKQLDNGENYFSLMEKNLKNLVIALQYEDKSHQGDKCTHDHKHDGKCEHTCTHDHKHDHPIK